MSPSMSVESMRNATLSAASFMIDSTFQGLSNGLALAGKGVSLASEGVLKGASLAGQGASWIGHQVVALEPVLKQGLQTVVNQAARIASTVATIATETFTVALSAMQQAYKTSEHFVKTHPHDIKVGLGSALAAVVTLLAIQTLFSEKKTTHR